MVDSALFVEGAVEGAGGGGGITDEEEFHVVGGHHGFDALVDGFGDAFGFVNDDQDIFAVEALESVEAGGGEAEGVAVFRQLPTGVQHPPAELIGGAAVQGVNLTPQHVSHLPEGGGSAQHDGGVVGVEIPQDGDGGGEVLAEAVAGLHRHARLAGEGHQDLFLLAPQLHPQDFPGEPHRVNFLLSYVRLFGGQPTCPPLARGAGVGDALLLRARFAAGPLPAKPTARRPGATPQHRAG